MRANEIKPKHDKSMKSKLIITATFIFIFSMSLLAQSELDGTWKGNIQGPGGNMEMTYNFKTEGNKLEGTIETPMGSREIENGSISEKEFAFDLQFREMTISHKGEVVSENEVVIKNGSISPPGSQG
jgi:hypothetical protein